MEEERSDEMEVAEEALEKRKEEEEVEEREVVNCILNYINPYKPNF